MKRELWALVVGVLCTGLSYAAPQDYQLKVEVNRKGAIFQTQASFYLPLTLCQSYRYLTDYEAATHIPGVIASTTVRLDVNKARVERDLQERLLFFPIKMRMVLEFTELPQQGTDFVQISGEAKSYKGSWRLEPESRGTWFKYQAESEPDTLLPKTVVEYFIKNRLASSFEAIAKTGADRREQTCP